MKIIPLLLFILINISFPQTSYTMTCGPYKEIVHYSNEKLKHKASANIEFSLDGKKMITACGELVRIWNVSNDTFYIENQLSISKKCYSVKISPNNNFIAACYRNDIDIYDLSGKHIINLDAKKIGPITHAEFSPSGKYLVCTTIQGYIKLWYLNLSNENDSFVSGFREIKLCSEIINIAFSEIGDHIVIGEIHKNTEEESPEVTQNKRISRIAIYTIPEFKLIKEKKLDEYAYLYSVACANHFSIMFAQDGFFYKWNPNESLEAENCFGNSHHKLNITAFRPSAQLILSQKIDGCKSFYLWSFTSDDICTKITASQSIFSAALSPYGKYLALGLQDGSITLLKHNMNRGFFDSFFISD